MIGIILLLIYGVSMVIVIFLWKLDSKDSMENSEKDMAFPHKIWFMMSVVPILNIFISFLLLCFVVHHYLMRGLNRLKDPKTEEP